MKPVLQVALDLMHLKRAVEIGKEAVEGGADWIEAGTPLIKSEGVESLRSLKRAFPDRILVADLKTMDVGGFEVEIAAKAGADVVTVMGLADDGTISEAVMSGRKYGTKVMIDMMNVRDKMARAREVEALGASYICLHVAVDEQMKGGRPPTEMVKEVASAVSIPIAVAGGINPETAPDFVQCGAEVVIVGGGISKAEDVTAAALRVKEAIETGEIRGAALDVFEEEPLPPESPLWEMEEVYVMPHVSGAFRDYYAKVADLVRENLSRIERGDAPVNRVA